MKNLFIYSITLIFLGQLHAQDAYHTSLQTMLQTEYSLPEGEWVFSNTESIIYQIATGYGGNYSVQAAADDQSFDRTVKATISRAGSNPWDAGWVISNSNAMRTGDRMLAVFYLRSVGGSGEVNFLVENNTTFAKEVYLQLPVSEEWRWYIIPFSSMANYTVGSCNWGFHLANKAQTIEIGGFTALNYKRAVELSALPSRVNNQFYGGYEEDAAWRSAADDRIDRIRKADVQIQVTNSAGEPVEDAVIELNMIRHQFDFGSAILASRIAGNNAYNRIYENKIRDLDGKRHGFNTVVFENDLKWDGWEEEWLVNKSELQKSVAWLVDNDIKIRGHVLVWPGTPYLPDDIVQNYNDLDYIRNRVCGHIEEIMTYPGIGEAIHDWDVLNEVTLNESLANAFRSSPDYTTGRELYPEIFQKVHEVDSTKGLWLNDYVTMTLGNTAGDELYERLKSYTAELVEASEHIDGIGFQGHIGGFPYGIYDVLGTLDDFYDSFGLKAKITEFDLPSFIDEELAANYLRDFMTAVYSHESTDGFLFWSFWDGQTYMNAGSNLYRNDWSETPAHAAFVDLLFDKWWSEESLATNASGAATARVFKGLYEVSYQCDGTIIRDTINVSEAFNYTLACDNITTNTATTIIDKTINVYPNPSNGLIQIEQDEPQRMRIRLLDMTGKLILAKEVEQTNNTLEIDAAKGIYFLELKTADRVSVQKIIIE
ncbi:MAG: endo-1,4-beta-xylanase [Bacteroidota bacterium]